MADLSYIPLPKRCVLSISGPDAAVFLQGLITNDMDLVSRNRAIYAALLTPQGKYLHDFFVLAVDSGFLLDCERDRREDLVTRLSRYRLRAKVDIQETDFNVFSLIGEGINAKLALTDEPGAATDFADGIACTDPRTATLGARAYLPLSTNEGTLQAAGFEKGDLASYDTLRYSLAISDGAPEIEPEKSYPMEFGLDRLNGVSFSKGCFVGQEVTVRMKNRDLVRKSLAPVTIEGTLPAIGTQLTLDDATAGELRGIAGDNGLALIRKESLDQALEGRKPFKAENTLLYPVRI